MKKKKLISIPAAIAGACAVFSGLVYYEVMGRKATLYEKIAAGVNGEPDPEELEKEENDERYVWFRQQKFRNYFMINDRGQTLRGYLLEADTPSDVYVLCSHGYRSDGKGEFRFVSKYYHDKNFNVFIVDHQSAGESDGNFISFGYYESKDIIKWAEFLKENFGKDIKIVLHGVSMGCATVTLASADKDLPENVKFTVADCGYTSMEDEFSSVLKGFKISSFPIVPLTNIWCRLIGKFSYKEVQPIEAVKKARVPMLFIHGKEDTFVPTEMVYRLYDACTSDKELLLVDGAIHARSYYVNPEACNAKIDTFIEKYI